MAGRRAKRGRVAVQVTREGGWFIGVTALVGLAAVGLASNLLLLLFVLLASLAVASLALAALSLRGLRVRRRLPRSVQVGAAVHVGLEVTNGRRRGSAFSVEVEDRLVGAEVMKRCWFLKVPAGRVQRTEYRHSFPRRGRYRFGALRVATRFPLGWFRVSWPVRDDDVSDLELVVLPRLVAVTPPWLAGLDEQGDEAQRPARRAQPARRGELLGLRPFRDGDDARDIHWRSSARRGRLLVRERERQAMRRAVILLDNGLPGGAACDDGPLPDDPLIAGLERAVELAASLAAHWLWRGYAVQVMARGGALAPMPSSPWTGTACAGRLGRLLHALALLPAVDERVPFPSFAVAPGVVGCRVTRDGVLPLRASEPRVSIHAARR